ncbi:Phosphotransferase enzyme family protein [Micromonospora pallida]|uniref:Phosphotransferase enzyme family protein n=1 Tax=Micromonospora pallida TaxID=145854 RepID=A0A1C6RYT3_9ACTN|nr:Phosphotransferase enzyme family protein [Micromonospora pallida]
MAWAAYGRRLRSAQRLTGGTRKGVYRLSLDGGTTGIGYVWNDDENYWPAAVDPDRNTFFADDTGIDLFVAAHREFTEAGVRVPGIVLLDRSRRLVPGDVAAVEDVRGGSLERLTVRDPDRAGAVLRRLGAAVRTMHGRTRDHAGRPGDGRLSPGRAGRPGNGGPSPNQPNQSVEQVVLDRALRQLAVVASRVDRIADVRDRLADTLRERCAVLSPRTRFGLIHSELGPDHVLVDDRDEPVLIDVEGAGYLDVEWEHAFLELRFGAGYRHLAVGGLDVDRLRFYRLALHLSLVEGPLRLLDGPFPDRAGMLAIVEHNIGRTLAQLD